MSTPALVVMLKNSMAEDLAGLGGRLDATDKRLSSLERKQTEDRRSADEGGGEERENPQSRNFLPKASIAGVMAAPNRHPNAPSHLFKLFGMALVALPLAREWLDSKRQLPTQQGQRMNSSGSTASSGRPPAPSTTTSSSPPPPRLEDTWEVLGEPTTRRLLSRKHPTALVPPPDREAEGTLRGGRVSPGWGGVACRTVRRRR